MNGIKRVYMLLWLLLSFNIHAQYGHVLILEKNTNMDIRNEEMGHTTSDSCKLLYKNKGYYPDQPGKLNNHCDLFPSNAKQIRKNNRKTEQHIMSPLFWGPDLTVIYDYAEVNSTTHVLSVESTIYNGGDDPASGFRVGWYLSQDFQVDAGDYLLMISDDDVDLNAYSQITFTGQKDLDDLGEIPGGTYWVLVVADDQSTVLEFNEYNNISHNLCITVTPSLPDLGFYYGLNSLNGFQFNDITKQLRMVLSIGNYGSVASPQCRVGWYLSDDWNFDRWSDTYVACGFIDALEPNCYVNAEFTGDLSGLDDIATGYYYLWAWLDDLKNIEEIDEDNNADFFVRPLYFDGTPTVPDIHIYHDELTIRLQRSIQKEKRKEKSLSKSKNVCIGNFVHEAIKPGELLVQIKSNAPVVDDEGYLQSLGLSVMRRYQLIFRGYHVQIVDGMTLDEKVDALSRNGNFLIIEANNVQQMNATFPNDPGFTGVYGLNNTGQTGGSYNADIDAVEAWDITTGSKAVVVGVIDSGTDLNHADLQANLWTNPGEVPGNGIDDDENGYIDDVHGWDFVDDDNDPSDRVNGHGTHCAGTIGAAGNNGVGVTGVCWQVSLMPLRVLNDEGEGETSDIIAAIEYAAQNGADLTSNSYGGQGQNQFQKTAIQNSNMLFVAAAGNESLDIDENQFSPAGYDLDNILSVAAIDHTNELCTFSNFGYFNVDLGAYGKDILSTCIPGNFVYSPGWNLDPDEYRYMDGTSMACPQVAGAAALILSQYPDMHWSDLKAALIDNVDIIDPLVGRCVSNGKLNVASAMTNLGQNGETGLFVIQNQGGKTLTIQSLDTDQTWLSTSGHTACPFEILPLASQVIQVDVDWTAVSRTSYGQIHISSDDADESQVSISITAEGGSAVEQNHHLPQSLCLYPNYPNPFNASTLISFDLPEQSHVFLFVYNTLGQCVQQLIDEKMQPGRHQVIFDASGIESGIYMVRLQTTDQIQMQKVILVK